MERVPCEVSVSTPHDCSALARSPRGAAAAAADVCSAGQTRDAHESVGAVGPLGRGGSTTAATRDAL